MWSDFFKCRSWLLVLSRVFSLPAQEFWWLLSLTAWSWGFTFSIFLFSPLLGSELILIAEGECVRVINHRGSNLASWQSALQEQCQMMCWWEHISAQLTNSSVDTFKPKAPNFLPARSRPARHTEVSNPEFNFRAFEGIVISAMDSVLRHILSGFNCQRRFWGEKCLYHQDYQLHDATTYKTGHLFIWNTVILYIRKVVIISKGFKYLSAISFKNNPGEERVFARYKQLSFVKLHSYFKLYSSARFVVVTYSTSCNPCD